MSSRVSPGAEGQSQLLHSATAIRCWPPAAAAANKWRRATAAARWIGTGVATREVQSLVVCTHVAGRLNLDHVGLLRCYQLVCWLLVQLENRLYMYIHFFT